MNRTPRPLLCAVLACALALPACVSTPTSGQHIVVAVTALPHRRQQLQVHPGLSLALQQGVSRADVQAGRLVITGCQIENGHGTPLGVIRHGYTLLPAGVTVRPGDVLEVAAQEADGTDGPYARFFARYLRTDVATDADYFPYRYSVSGKAFRCGPVPGADGRMRVEVFGEVKSWTYDEAEAEAQRNALIADEDLQRGRIAIGECATGVESWATWKVRLPLGLQVQVGDYLEALAGSYEAPRSTGPISEGLRVVARPPLADFVPTVGRADYRSPEGRDYKVGCGARDADR
ncbi:MAG: hypothetical protein KGL68_14820 [Burkholderiales bacterium]|nr:hypothetical protein [Burkholderiales bacterium]